MKITPEMIAAGAKKVREVYAQPNETLATEVYTAMESVRRAAFEDRKRASIERARAAGRLRGRQSTIDKAQLIALAAERGPEQAAREMGIGRSSAYRILRQNGHTEGT